MSIDVNESNFKFLSSLKGNEIIGVNQQGLFFVKGTDSKTTTVAQEIFQGEQFTNAQKVVEKFLASQVSDLSANPMGTALFTQLITLFVRNKLLTSTQKNKVLEQWYHQRLNDLQGDFDLETSSAIVATEMAFDSHIPAQRRDKIFPDPVEGGLSGSYFLKNLQGEVAGIFKPKFQEYGMPLNPKGHRKNYNEKKPVFTQREGHIQGTSWLNEVAVFEISDNFIGVPDTTEITLIFPVPEEIAEETGKPFMMQMGSFQKFVAGKPLAELDDKGKLAIPAAEIQKIAIFDLLTVNGDRNFGNILFDGQKCIPIDHGLCFSTWLEINGDWIVMPQLKEALDQDVRDWILNFDIDESVERLRELGVDRKAILLHQTMYLFLLARIEKGENVFQIAEKCIATKEQGYPLLQQLVIDVTDALPEELEEDDDAYFAALQERLAKL